MPELKVRRPLDSNLWKNEREGRSKRFRFRPSASSLRAQPPHPTLNPRHPPSPFPRHRVRSNRLKSLKTTTCPSQGARRHNSPQLLRTSNSNAPLRPSTKSPKRSPTFRVLRLRNHSIPHYVRAVIARDARQRRLGSTIEQNSSIGLY